MKSIKTHIKNKSWILGLTIALSSCGDYLDKQPSTSTNAPITEAPQLLSLIDYTTNTEEACASHTYCTDDNGMSCGLLDAYPSAYENGYFTGFFLDGIMSKAYDGFWNGEYKKIYTANTIIEAAPNMADQATAKEALANAYFMRALSYFTMAQYYCRPYCEANKEELGLPIREATDFEENLSRVTLGETYDKIFDDLAKAAELTSVQNVNEDLRWRVSKCAVDAFYARLYMVTGDYQKALEHANSALAKAPKLFNYNDFKEGRSVKYAANEVLGLPEQTLYYCETNNWSGIQYLYFQEYIYTRFCYNGSQWFIPSESLKALYDQQNDMRFKWFFIPHSNRRFNCTYDEYRYDPLYDGRYCFSGFGTPELMLIKAEAEIRLGQWQNALAGLDELRENRYATGTWTPLTAASQQEALKKVLEERRREMPFAIRMMDIKRFSVNETPDDDVIIERDFYQMTLGGYDKTVKHIRVAGNDKELALPITDVEINSSHGMIQQNPY